MKKQTALTLTTLVGLFGLGQQALADNVTINDASVTWAFGKGTAGQKPDYDPYEANAYFTGDTITLGAEMGFYGTASWIGATGAATFTSIKNMTSGSNSSSPVAGNTLTFTTCMTNGGVFIPTKLTFDAARFGTDGGKWQVSVCCGSDELVLGRDFVPNRSGKNNDLSQYSYDINGLAADAESPLKVKFSIYELGKGKSHGLANVVVSGTVMGTSDDAPLEILSTSPENGVKDLTRSGKIIVNYNARITQGEGSVTLTNTDDGTVRVLQPVWSSRALTLNYVGLDYGASYRLDIPEGYVVSVVGDKKASALDFRFSVLSRPIPTARTFNAIVDGSLMQLSLAKGTESGKDYRIAATDDMPAQYRSIQAAIDDAPTDCTEPYLIYIKNGYYRDPNFSFTGGYGFYYNDPSSSTGTETTRFSNGAINHLDSCRLIHINKPNIHLVGQSRDSVIIATDRLCGSMDDHSRPWYHVSAGAAVEVMSGGTDFYMGNLTVDNENWTVKKQAGPQALSFCIQGDRAILNNVRARSYQDTYFNGGTYNRTFWNGCEIEGAVDFIYGSSDVWFENCLLNICRSSGGFIVAPNHPKETRWGYVFNNCHITTDDVSDPSRYSIWLGRPWHEYPKTVFLHTQMDLTPMDSLWYATMGGLPAIWAVYDFYNAKGKALSTVSRTTYYNTDSSGNRVYATAKSQLSEEEVAEYTITNVFAGDGTTTAAGYWSPQTYVDKPSTPIVMKSGTTVTWTADKYVVCYIVFVNGKPMAFPTDCRYEAKAGDIVQIQSVGEHGALSDVSPELTIDGQDGSSIDRIEDRAVYPMLPAYDLMGRKTSFGASVSIRNGRKYMTSDF